MRPPFRVPAARGAGTLVLIADADEHARKYCADLFGVLFGEVVEAADGPEALAKAIATRPDAIVIVMNLTGIGGLQLCELLKKDDATRRIPILVLDDDQAGARQSAREAGADSVLPRSCGPGAVLAEVRRLLDRVQSPTSVPEAARERTAESIFDHDGRQSLTKAHLRRDTTAPPLSPPLLRCPLCDRPLIYQHSHIGGVSAKQPEQWDYYGCSTGCGSFQYRQRTRKLRRVS
jgi:CheY-like chemotaxis protein